MVDLVDQHRGRFGGSPVAVSAPARVNLIGEHTDYTGGYVLPMAIGFKTTAVVTPRQDSKALLYSANYGESVEYDLHDLKQSPRHHWSDYPIGVAWALQGAGVKVPGFALSLEGDVPLGAGLSSSASVEVATAMALLSAAGTMLPGETIATLCRKAENEYVQASCGIMDQFVIVNAVKDRALLLDCRSLAYELLPLPRGVRVVVVNSMVQHSVATGEYGDRRGEAEHGQEILRKRNPAIELLRDATMSDLEAARAEMGEVSYRRCKHIITENARVLAVRDALHAGRLDEVGRWMLEAHRSMRDDFEASCPEIDTLVDLAVRTPGCFGARITGGGFGGCTVNLVSAEHAESFADRVRDEYRRTLALEAQIYVCEAVDGALAREKVAA